jgi:hypothetical protein
LEKKYHKIVLDTIIIEVLPTIIAEMINKVILEDPSITHIIDLHNIKYDIHFFLELYISFKKRKQAGQCMPILDLPRSLEKGTDNLRLYKQFLLEEYFQRSSTGEFDIMDTKKWNTLKFDNPIAYFNLLLRNNLFVENTLKFRNNLFVENTLKFDNPIFNVHVRNNRNNLFVDWQFPKGIPWNIGFVFNLK